MKRLLAVVCVLSALGWAQGACHKDYTLRLQSNGLIGVFQNVQIRICAWTDTARPCTPVLLYSDPGLTQVLNNPISSNLRGEYGYCTTPGAYNEQLTVAGQIVDYRPVTLGGAGSATPGGADKSIQFRDGDVLNGFGSYDPVAGLVTLGTPASFEAWFDAAGLTADQTLHVPDATGTIALQEWVSAQSYLTSAALAGYATQSWTNTQGFLKAADLTGYATQAWVTAGFQPLGSYLTSVACANLPALTGGVTTSAGSCTTTVASVPVGALPTGHSVRICEVHIGAPTGSALVDADDEPVSCYNDYGVTATITAVRCYADAGSPTVMVTVTGGSNVLSGNLTCGTGSWVSGSLSGTPTLLNTGTLDANIVAAGGTAKYIRIVITEVLP